MSWISSTEIWFLVLSCLCLALSSAASNPDDNQEKKVKEFVSRTYGESLVGAGVDNFVMLTDEQVVAFREHEKKTLKVIQAFYKFWAKSSEFDEVEFEKSKKQFVDELQALDQGLGEFLLPHQIRRLKQLSNQKRIKPSFENAFGITPLSDDLRLSSADRDNVKRLATKLEEEFATKVRSSIEELHSLRTKVRRRIAGKLSMPQQRLLNRHFGNDETIFDDVSLRWFESTERQKPTAAIEPIELERLKFANIESYFRHIGRLSSINELDLTEYQRDEITELRSEIVNSRSMLSRTRNLKQRQAIIQEIQEHGESILLLLDSEQCVRLTEILNQRLFQCDQADFGVSNWGSLIELTDVQSGEIDELISSEFPQFAERCKVLSSELAAMREKMFKDLASELSSEQLQKFQDLIGPENDVDFDSRLYQWINKYYHGIQKE